MVSDFEQKAANASYLYFSAFVTFATPLTMGTQQVSAGADVITPQHRSYRVPQGSPKSLAGREEVSLSPHVVIAPNLPPFFYEIVDRSEAVLSSPP